MIIFHQYGARRTGTNYVQALLEENYSNVMVLDNIVWKHAPSPPADEFIGRFLQDRERHFNKTCAARQDLYECLQKKVLTNEVIPLLTIKNPYAWVESMWRYTKNLRIFNPHELGTKYVFLDPAQKLSSQEDNVTELMNSYNQRYQQWGHATRFVVRYEDLLIDYESILSFFEEQHSLQRINKDLLNIKSGCDPTPANLKHINPDWDYANYYLTESYLKNLPSNIIECITETTDWSLFEKYQYSAI
tara:strand:+ start:1017 stop:1754 length:738 start_codon:yes stop_codon:yes gene_type:complete